jgi:hypothetical protein
MDYGTTGSGTCPFALNGVAVAAHAVAVAGHEAHAAGVVQDGARDGGVFEDVSPFGDPSVGGQDDAAVFIAAADDPGTHGGRYPSSSHYADIPIV